MPETQPSIFEEEFATHRRKDLLPWWIKIANWFFMLMGFCAVIIFFVSLAGRNAAITLYGLSSNGDPFSAAGLLLTGIALFNGITAYGLWSEKDWAVNVGMASAFIGIIVCSYTTITGFSYSNGMFQFRLELILLFFFLRKLLKIRQEWDNRVAG